MSFETKSPRMKKFLEENFGTQTAMTNKICVWCGQPATQFKDTLSEKEYSISGLCQACQDKTFGT